jgi:hypothetical protein
LAKCSKLNAQKAKKKVRLFLKGQDEAVKIVNKFSIFKVIFLFFDFFLRE